mmetsp:Transcript_28319/g.88241  ORF Transcript_28319/g.88241 Transcript_28319/m.88241 type:complete len:206 (-) Transcript_28319:1133-1750(-)
MPSQTCVPHRTAGPAVREQGSTERRRTGSTSWTGASTSTWPQSWTGSGASRRPCSARASTRARQTTSCSWPRSSSATRPTWSSCGSSDASARTRPGSTSADTPSGLHTCPASPTSSPPRYFQTSWTTSRTTSRGSSASFPTQTSPGSWRSSPRSASCRITSMTCRRWSAFRVQRRATACWQRSTATRHACSRCLTCTTIAAAAVS